MYIMIYQKTEYTLDYIKFKEVNKIIPCKKLLLDETNRLLSTLIDKNYKIDITEDSEFYYVRISLEEYWQKAVPSMLRWDSIRLDIFNYLHYICTEFHVDRDVVIIKNIDEEHISLKKLENMPNCKIKSIKFKIDK